MKDDEEEKAADKRGTMSIFLEVNIHLVRRSISDTIHLQGWKVYQTCVSIEFVFNRKISIVMDRHFSRMTDGNH